MRLTSIALLCFVLAFGAACGSDSKKKSSSSKVGTNNSNSVNIDNNLNSIDPTRCGNGALDANEVCDPAITAGDGACPSECPDLQCAATALVGDAGACTARCEATPVACADDDGCCPSGCDANSDNDCTNVCGNGEVEANESCDGNCPTSCDDSDACTVDSFSGSADNCTLICAFAVKTACTGGDGCCPEGCTAATDSDCSTTCGNGTIDDNETCDGDCPTTCGDADACTRDVLTGSAESCSAQCSFSRIASCTNADGCCPPGCTAQTDNDCACNPTSTCAGEGAECGTIFNGCQTVSCGACNNGEMCDTNTKRCEATSMVGVACTSNSQCGGLECLSATDLGWSGGYCSRGCARDSDCGAGANCGFQDDDGNGFCVRSCTTSSECGRNGYECYDRDQDGTLECSAVGTGNGGIGAPCDLLSECAGGQDASCIRQGVDWYQGYCTKSCDSNNDCAGGSHCSEAYGLCMKSCATDSTCRTGYACLDLDQDFQSECFTAAVGNGAVGAACVGDWDCVGREFGLCISDALNNFPGGYCTVACGSGQGTCEGGSTCWNSADGDFCVDACATDSECRTNYTCRDLYDDGTSLACLP